MYDYLTVSRPPTRDPLQCRRTTPFSRFRSLKNAALGAHSPRAGLTGAVRACAPGHASDTGDSESSARAVGSEFSRACEHQERTPSLSATELGERLGGRALHLGLSGMGSGHVSRVLQLSIGTVRGHSQG